MLVTVDSRISHIEVISYSINILLACPMERIGASEKLAPNSKIVLSAVSRQCAQCARFEFDGVSKKCVVWVACYCIQFV